MKQTIGCLLVTAGSLSFSGCANKSWGNFWDDRADLTSFSINDQRGIINGNSIRVTLKWTSLTNLVATFTTTGTSVDISGVAQVSGVSVNDFSSPKNYSVRAVNGATKTYTVTVSNIFPFADTGQTNCYDTTLQSCGTVAAGYPRQDGMFIDIPAARSITGPAQHANYSNDFTTKDNVTGLLWKSCSEGQAGASCTGTPTTMTWASANDTACQVLNSANNGAGYAGYANWRLPYAEELRTLIHQGFNNPAIDQLAFPGTASTPAYWTASHYTPNTANAWSITFSIGFISNALKSTLLNVRCVSGGGGTYLPGFADNGDGTVSDTTNLLLWTKCSLDAGGAVLPHASGCAGTVGTVQWQTALQYCNNLNFLGKSWRLPNAAELASIFELNSSATPINSTVFPATLFGYYWTSTTSPSTPANGMRHDFSTGATGNIAKIGNSHAARCVSGP